MGLSKGRVLAFFSPSTCTVPCRVSSTQCMGYAHPNPDITTTGHVVFSLVWWGIILAYGGLVTWQWAVAPDSESLSQVPSGRLARPPPVWIEAWCTNPPHCGMIQISSNYTMTIGGASAACADTPGLRTSDSLLPVSSISCAGASAASPCVAKATLCYTGQGVVSTNVASAILPSVAGVQVGFSAINPGFANASLKAQGVVRVVAAAGVSASDVIRVVNMDRWQVKSLVLGQSVRQRKDGTLLAETQLYPIATQYEGRRATMAATLIVALGPYADVVTVESKAPSLTAMSLFSLAAGWLGVVWVLKATAPYVTVPLMLKLFKKTK